MSRTVAATLAAAAAFAVSGFLSGLLIDEHGGAGGALEWLLRTGVVLAGAVATAGGSVLVLRLRRRVRSRPLGWAAAVAAWAAFAWLLAVPAGYAVYLTHLPGRAAVHDADLGAPKERVALSGADGSPVRAWYVPSRNGAAVIALHGTGGNRLGVARHARLLVRHGYGVLALDLRGHGESGGRSTSLPWRLDRDLDAAVAFLAARPDVAPRRIGALGVSLGGEVALQAAARRADLRAIVAEGLMGSGPADSAAAGAGAPVVAQMAVLDTLNRVLSGSAPPASDAELIGRVAPRPVLLISAGRAAEASANRAFARRGGSATEHWNLPAAAHGAALRTDPAGYERRVIGFLDRTLHG